MIDTLRHLAETIDRTVPLLKIFRKDMLRRYPGLDLSE